MPIHHVKKLLGHANISTTDTYVNAGRIHLQESMRKVEEVRNSATKMPHGMAQEATEAAAREIEAKGNALLH